MTLYQIYCDNYLLDDMRTDDYIVADPKINFEKNKVAGLTFTVLKTHPHYDKIRIKRSVIELRKNGKAIFRGRPTEYSQDLGLKMAVDVEGVLAFLNDSIFEPFEFQGSPAEFLTNVINNHNSQVQEWQQFKIGQIDTLDNNDYINRSSIEYLKSWEIIETRLLNIGGLLIVRYEDDGNYLDWIEGTQEQLNTATQAIEYGENLISLKKTNSANSTYTAILPLGAQLGEDTETQQRLTIEELADDDTTDIVKQGKWIYSKAGVEKYGWVAPKPTDTTWDDVTIATNLLKKATALLVDDYLLIDGTLELNAYDLSLSNEEINSFNFLDYIPVKSTMHSIEETYLLSKFELPYKQPQNAKITVGSTKSTLTDEQLGNKQQQSDLIERIETITRDYATNEKVDAIVNQQIENSTQILQDAQAIILGALESYVETSVYEEFKQTVEAQFSVMADEIAINFTTTSERIIEVDGEYQAKFNEVYKHIAFNENGITISAGENTIKLRLDNDMIAFYKGEIDENDLTKNRFGHWDGENFYTGNIIIDVNEKAQFGNFAFVPRSDGSLAFLKVGE